MGDREAAIRRNPQVVHRALAGEGSVLLHLESGQYHGLNEMGALIWSSLDDSPTVDELVARLRERLLDPPENLRAEVERFLAAMRERNLIAG